MVEALIESIHGGELCDIARKIESYRVERQLTFSALLRKNAQLGSDKTFKKILNEDFTQMDIEKQLINYRSVLSMIETLIEDRGPQDIYDDLYATVQVRRAFAEAMRENSIARFILVQGPNGSGKSSARQSLLEKYGSRLLLIEANVAWADSPMALMAVLLRKLGNTDIPYSQLDRFNKCLELLGKVRRGVIIEEGHHLGPRCLNLLKTFINQSPGEWGVFAVDKLWKNSRPVPTRNAGSSRRTGSASGLTWATRCARATW